MSDKKYYEEQERNKSWTPTMSKSNWRSELKEFILNAAWGYEWEPSLATDDMEQFIESLLKQQRQELREQVEDLTIYKIFKDRGSDGEFIHRGDVLALLDTNNTEE